MNCNNLHRSLEASRFYYAKMYEAMRPAHERIRLKRRKILLNLYREAAEIEARLRAIDPGFYDNYGFTTYKSNPYHDEVGRFTLGRVEETRIATKIAAIIILRHKTLILHFKWQAMEVFLKIEKVCFPINHTDIILSLWFLPWGLMAPGHSV